jgi:hypothetical protein
MAKRIGKYKVTKRESAVSLVDGGAATGLVKLDGNSGLSAGTGITSGTGTIYKSWVNHIGNAIIETNILMDLTGLASTAANDIIGKADTANSHIGQVTAAVTGTIFGATIKCFETPAGGDPDINLAFADESTLAENAALSSGTNNGTIIDSGDLAAGSVTAGGASVPAANQFLYLVSGAATNADYTAGKILIQLYGTV